MSREVELLRQQGIDHERSFLETLEDVVLIDPDAGLEEQSRLTREAMHSGASYIYQAYLENDSLAGYPDFLQRVDSPSALGDFSYRILDTKLAATPTAANAVQLIHYAQIAEEIQGRAVDQLLIIHGDGSRSEIKVADYLYYYRELLQEYRDFLNGCERTEPFPVPACQSCSYQKNCQNYWQEKDHLAALNGITPALMAKFKKAAINDVETLMNAPWSENMGVSANEFARLSLQALAQKKRQIHLKDQDALARLKTLAAGGILLTFFQTLSKASGTALFYVGLKIFSGERFEEIFIHNTSEESAAFQRVIRFAVRYLDKRPRCFLMVWSVAEIKVLYNLSSRYNTCQDEVDTLIYDRRVVAVQGLISEAFFLPADNNRLASVARLFSSDDSVSRALDANPLLLNELFSSAGVDAEQLITQRAMARLKAIEMVLVHVCRYEKDELPLPLSQ